MDTVRIFGAARSLAFLTWVSHELTSGVSACQTRNAALTLGLIEKRDGWRDTKVRSGGISGLIARIASSASRSAVTARKCNYDCFCHSIFTRRLSRLWCFELVGGRAMLSSGRLRDLGPAFLLAGLRGSWGVSDPIEFAGRGVSGEGLRIRTATARGLSGGPGCSRCATLPVEMAGGQLIPRQARSRASTSSSAWSARRWPPSRRRKRIIALITKGWLAK